MSANFFSSKFFLSLVTTVAATVLKALGIIDDTTYGAIASISTAVYGAANVAEKATQKKGK